MGRGDKWTSDEDDALRQFYHDKGVDWDMWDYYIPGRTRKGIFQRAKRLGISHPRKRGVDFELERGEVTAMFDMHAGLAPSQIDKKRFWAPGRAHDLIVTAWMKDKQSKWGLLRGRHE